MNTGNIVSIVVVMIFAYIIAKHKLLPYLARRKMEKKIDDVGEKVENLGYALPYPVMQTLQGMQTAQQTADTAKTTRFITYFDMRLVPVGKEDDESLICANVNEMLLELGKLGISPELGFCRISDNCLLAYATYKL